MSKQKNLVSIHENSWNHEGIKEIDLDDLEVTRDYEVDVYYPLQLEAKRRYMSNPDDDVHNTYRGEAVNTLLEIVKDLNRRIRELEKKS